MSVKELLEDDDNYYIATELCEGGELFDHLLENGKFSENKCSKVIKQVLTALNHMHSMKPLPMAHRDLKPENILLESKSKENLQIKIADFGFAKTVSS